MTTASMSAAGETTVGNTTHHAYVIIWCCSFLLPVIDVWRAGIGNAGAYDMRPLVENDVKYLLPLVILVLLCYAVSSKFNNIAIRLAALAHALDLWIRFQRMPALWDHEWWSLCVSLAFLASIFSGSGGGMDFLKSTRLIFGVLYLSAAFWKLNSSFLNVEFSCAPLLVMELLTSYLPDLFLDRWFLRESFFLRWIATYSPHITISGEFMIALGMILVATAVYPSHRNNRNRVIRNVTIGSGIAFHTAVYLLPLNSAGGFSLDCVSRYICFFDPVEIQELLSQQQQQSPQWLRCLFVAAVVSPALATVRSLATDQPPDAGILGYGCLLVLYYFLMTINVKEGSSSDAMANNSEKKKTKVSVRMFALVGLTVFYAFALPILGLQQMGASTMYANLRNYGPSNHLLVPTAILGDSHLFGGGLVTILHSSCESLNLHLGYIDSKRLFPKSVLESLGSVRNTNVNTKSGAYEQPVQFFPYCLEIDHSRKMLIEDYWGSIGDAGSLPPYRIPISVLAKALHKAEVSEEGYSIKLVNGGTSQDSPTANLGRERVVTIFASPFFCNVQIHNAETIDCKDDEYASLLLDRIQNYFEGRGGWSWIEALRSKLLLPYPQLLQEGEACIT